MDGGRCCLFQRMRRRPSVQSQELQSAWGSARTCARLNAIRREGIPFSSAPDHPRGPLHRRPPLVESRSPVKLSSEYVTHLATRLPVPAYDRSALKVGIAHIGVG